MLGNVLVRRGDPAATAPLNEAHALARALADGDAQAQVEALAIFDRLGAAPAAQRRRESMRAQPARSIPRGPRGATRANRFGLTALDLDILAPAARGLTSAQIAATQHRSVRTVDDHVASILSKLGVASRNEAITQAKAHDRLAKDRPSGSAR